MLCLCTYKIRDDDEALEPRIAIRSCCPEKETSAQKMSRRCLPLWTDSEAGTLTWFQALFDSGREVTCPFSEKQASWEPETWPCTRHFYTRATAFSSPSRSPLRLPLHPLPRPPHPLTQPTLKPCCRTEHTQNIMESNVLAHAIFGSSSMSNINSV